MSCHAIGHGINTIMEEVVGLFEEGKLSVEAIRRIGSQAMQAVNYCDGNSDEAVEVMLGYRCGRCLKKASGTNPLYSVYCIPYKMWEGKDPCRIECESLASYELCADCFDLIMGMCFDDPEFGKRERQKMDEDRAKKNAYH